MEENVKTYRSFEDLDVYKAARDLRRRFYQVAKSLPESEKFNLNLQIRRAAVSLTNNLAEGHGRFHYTDNIRFVLISRGSLEELMDDLNICEDEGYATPSQLAPLRTDCASLMRQLNGYIRYLRESKAGASLGLREETIPYRLDNGDTALEDLA